MAADYETRLLRQGANWATPPQGAAHKALVAEVRRAELARLEADNTLRKAMATTRRNTAGTKLLALLAGRLQRAQLAERALREKLLW